MPYCRNCGRHIEEENWLCPSCQYQIQPPTSQPQTVIVQHGASNADEIIGAVFLIALIIGGIWFATSVEVFDCPRCNNDPWTRWTDSYCGYDGKVTLVQLLTYNRG